MVLKSLNCRGFSSGWNNFCFIKIILCIINMDHYRERQKQSSVQFSSVQLLNHIQLFVTPWIAAHQASLSITNSWSLLNWCPLGGWCHLTISSFFSCLQSFPALGSFPVSQLFASGGQSIEHIPFLNLVLYIHLLRNVLPFQFLCIFFPFITFFLLFLCSFIESCNIKCCSVAKSCATLCDSMDCSTSGFPVPHHLLEFAQVHVHWISDTIQPSHCLLPSSPSAFSFSQHQGLFQWVSCLHQVAKVLELQLQHQFFQSVFRIDFL